VALPYAPTPVYAHNVSCAVAVAVVKGCSSSLRKGGCFGESAVPALRYKGIREPALPEQAPVWKPLGFACYQTFGRYTKGLPPMSINVLDPKPILCYRKANLTRPDAVVVQQIVAYVV
jgi:hypothetical protein